MASSRSTAERSTFHLPSDITIRILLRLPVKSLLRCKSVCKTWYALIETPNFVAQHARITQSTLDSASLLVTTFNRETKNYAMSLFNERFGAGPIDLDFPFLNRRNYVPHWDQNWVNYFFIAGVCDGLVCVNVSCLGFPLILCNPSTRQFREIPGAGWIEQDILQWSFDVKWLSFGFGFHPRANDYKLIRIVRYSTLNREDNMRADLYAMSSETWREIDVKKVSLFFMEIEEFGEIYEFEPLCGSSASAILNGVFYWPALLKETDQVVVMSFEMDDEVFKKTRIPEGLDIAYDDSTWQITEICGKPALFVYRDHTGFGVWVLNEKESSWTKQVKIEPFPRIVNYMSSGKFVITVIGLKNGEVLATLFDSSSGALKLFVYNPNSQETKDLFLGQVPNYSHVYLCAGTLHPVLRDNEVVLD